MVTPQLKKRLFDGVKIFFFLLSLVFFYYLLDHIGFTKIGTAFKNIGLPGLFVLIIMGLTERVLDSASLKYANPHKMVLWKIHAINGVGGLVNSLFPWDMGEVVKGAFIKKDASLQDSFTAVILYNLIFKLSKPLAIAVIILATLFMGSHCETYLLWLLVGASIVSFVPFVFISLAVRFSLATKLFSLFSKVLKRDLTTFLSSVKELEKRLELFRKERSADYYKVLFLQFSARIISLATFVFVAHLLHIEYGFTILAIGYAYINLFNYIALLIPARLGVTEGTSFLVFSMLGLDGGLGVMIVLILRINALVVGLLSSILLLFL
ncbi:flippase-like domain-containing protein [bacterium]|nr:flippase-like domain-containing protein [bacterium]